MILFKATLVLPLIIGVTMAQPECDLEGGWVGNLNHQACYLLGPIGGNEPLPDYYDWFKARDWCANQDHTGSFLATVKTQYQNDLIRLAVGQEENVKFWISANDLTVEDDWEWDLDSDGGTEDFLIYDHWAADQPDNGGGNEDCAIIDCDDSCKWYDVPCTETSMSIMPLCEYIPQVKSEMP